MSQGDTARPHTIESEPESGEPLEGSGFEDETPDDDSTETEGEEVTYA